MSEGFKGVHKLVGAKRKSRPDGLQTSPGTRTGGRLGASPDGRADVPVWASARLDAARPTGSSDITDPQTSLFAQPNSKNFQDLRISDLIFGMILAILIATN